MTVYQTITELLTCILNAASAAVMVTLLTVNRRTCWWMWLPVTRQTLQKPAQSQPPFCIVPDQRCRGSVLSVILMT